MAASVAIDYYREMVRDIRQRADGLPPESAIRRALESEILAAADARVAIGDINDLRGYWPPLVGFAIGNSIRSLTDLDSDLDLVRLHSPANTRDQLSSFLTATATDKPGVWFGGLFDLATKAIALRHCAGAEVDFRLPNSRRCDIRLLINGRPFHLEATVISEDDESREVAKRAWADQRGEGSVSYIRPGKYCPENAKGPSPYYDVLRVYGKIFDKLAPDLNLNKSQLHPNAPNVLLLSSHGCLRSDSPGLGWALDELFITHPQLRRIIPEGFSDFTLYGWINHKGTELLRSRELKLEDFSEREAGVFAALRRLGAIMLFDGCDHKGARINYNADDDCRVSHADIVELEELFRNRPSYYLR
jgi:hypothetical protein